MFSSGPLKLAVGWIGQAALRAALPAEPVLQELSYECAMTARGAARGLAWARLGARGLAWARLGLGALALVAPAALARPWVGEQAASGTGRVLARAMGGRDLALGLGAVLAIAHGSPARGWIGAGGLADTGDVAATLLAWRSLPRRGRLGVLAIAGGSVIASAVLAGALD